MLFQRCLNLVIFFDDDDDDDDDDDVVVVVVVQICPFLSFFLSSFKTFLFRFVPIQPKHSKSWKKKNHKNALSRKQSCFNCGEEVRVL